MAYLLFDDDTRACPISNPIDVPAAPRVITDVQKTEELVSLAPPRVTGAFRENGSPAGNFPPEVGQVFGSHGGDGTLAWTGRAADDARAIAIPLWIGRNYDWLTPELVQVVGEDGRVWGVVRSSFGFEQWGYWQVSRPPGSTAQFTIEVTDTRSWPEQWVSVGTPRALR